MAKRVIDGLEAVEIEIENTESVFLAKRGGLFANSALWEEILPALICRPPPCTR